MPVTLRSYRSCVVDTELVPAVPPVGAVVVVLPVVAGPERTGALSDWSTGPAGLVVTADVAMAPEDVAAVAGQRVWARVDSPDGGVRVLEGVAVADAGGTGLRMTGMLALADERRRAAPRVHTSRPARVSLEAADVRRAEDARTVDLSRTGARLRVPAASLEGTVGTVGGPIVTVEIDGVVGAVGQGETITAGAEVIRVDAALGELAVRFVDLPEGDAERLDRAVLTELSARRTASS